MGKESTLNLTIPVWTKSEDAKVSLNGQSLKIPASGNFLSIKQNWKTGDLVLMDLPLSIRIEAIKGHTSRDWSITTQAKDGKWIETIPETHNNHLVTLSQNFGNIFYVMSNSNQTITMEISPQPETQEAVQATFRLVTDYSKQRISDPREMVGSQTKAARFRSVSGVDGKPGTASLRLESKKSCFVCNDQTTKLGMKLRLECDSNATDEKFKKAVSFRLEKEKKQYHTMNFVMSGTERNFVLSPLYSLRAKHTMSTSLCKLEERKHLKRPLKH